MLVTILEVTFESRLQIVLDIRGEHGRHQDRAASQQHQVQQPDTGDRGEQHGSEHDIM